MRKEISEMNSKPNILLLFPDEHRGDWIPDHEEVPLKMPNLKKLMDAGVTFKNVITPSPLCAPARACLAAGAGYETCQVSDNSENYPLEKETFYTKLKESGYLVGGVGKFDLHKPVHFWGLDGWIDDLDTMGFTHGIDNAGKMDAVVSGKEEPKDPYMNALEKEGWREYHVSDMVGRGKKTHSTKMPEHLYCDNWLTQNAIDMISDFENDHPWFLQVNFTGPHPPFDITENMKKRWENVRFPEPINWEGDQEIINAVRQNYAAMLENIDSCIGKILTLLEETNQLENTVIIYSADHGEMLGDYNKIGKCRPEGPSIHIPLVIAGPNIVSGKVSDELVELQDLAATCCDFGETASRDFDDSISLRPILETGEGAHRDYQKSALLPKNQVHYIENVKIGWECVLNKKYKKLIWDKEKITYYDRNDDRIVLEGEKLLEAKGSFGDI